jgi:putative tryptophan/tyrosine transport system substrate-binding protein
VQRRSFITLLGGGAAWPLAAHAQSAGKLPTVGFMGVDAVGSWAPWAAAFAARLHELGWIEGRTIAIDYRWSEGRPERVADIAAEFVRLKVDVIVTYGIAVPTFKQATATIPIVFAVSPDPVGGGLVARLARPGGNVTGLSNQATDLAGKRLQLLREVVPQLHRLAMMVDVGNPQTVLEVGEVEAASRTLGLEVTPLEIRRADDIAPAFDTLRASGSAPPDGLFVVIDALVDANREQIIALALREQLPTIFGARNFVQPGGLMSYGPNLQDNFRRAAEYVNKILHGTKPGDIPVEQPTKFELVINLKTANALGLAVPQSVLARADEVIE